MGTEQDPDLTLRVGAEELVIRRRYEVASILNDVALGVWFLIGSVLFFFESTMILGTWFFVLGSAQLLVRPMIRLARRMYLTRVQSSSAGSGGDYDGDSQDF